MKKILLISAFVAFSNSGELCAMGQNLVATDSSARLSENRSETPKMRVAESEVKGSQKVEMPQLIEQVKRLANETHSLDCLVKIDDAINEATRVKNPSDFVASIMASIIPPASDEKLSSLFGPDFETGTFFLSERLSRPAFISPSDNLPFYEWVTNNVNSELLRLKKADAKAHELLCNKEIEKGISVNDFVFLSMFLVDKNQGKRLIEQVPNQIYQDVFRKLISFFMFDDVNRYPYAEKSYNEKVEAVSLAILDKISDVSVYDLFRYSIAAGALGVDMKSSASAASPIQRGLRNIIFYDAGKDEDFTEKVKRMKDELDLKVQEPLVIDFWKEFESDFLTNKEKKTLIWFHDDVAETVFDLFFIQKILSCNSKLDIISIPRSGKHGIRFGNDASSMDIKRYLDMPVFSALKCSWEKGQYRYSDAGPCWGAVYGTQLSDEAIDLVLNSSAILVKGSRSYEMLQGIKINSYYASMVCRDFSESVFDIDAESGASILIKQEAGLPSFQGFRERHKRSHTLPNGRAIMLASMTAQEYAKVVRHPNYQKIISRFPDRLSANMWLKDEAKRRQKSIADFILDIENAE